MLQRIFVILFCLGLVNNAFSVSAKEYIAKCAIAELEKLSTAEYTRTMEYCSSVVRDIVDSYYATTASDQKDRFFCLPDNIEDVELTGTVIVRLQREKRYIDEPLVVLVYFYLGLKYPCT